MLQQLAQFQQLVQFQVFGFDCGMLTILSVNGNILMMMIKIITNNS